MKIKVIRKTKGGRGSGNWNHKGRPGMVGGSSTGGGKTVVVTPPLETRLQSLRGSIANAAQSVYDDWDVDGGWDPGGGICDSVCQEMESVIHSKLGNVETRMGGWDGDDHAWLIVYNAKHAFGVDIPPHVYETGGGYSWEKIPGVKISAEDVAIWEIPRSGISDYDQ